MWDDKFFSSYLKNLKEKAAFDEPLPPERATGLFASWAVDPWPSREKGLIALVSPNWSDRKGNNEVSKCKLKKFLFGEKTKEKPANFATR